MSASTSSQISTEELTSKSEHEASKIDQETTRETNNTVPHEKNPKKQAKVWNDAVTYVITCEAKSGGDYNSVKATLGLKIDAKDTLNPDILGNVAVWEISKKYPNWHSFDHFRITKMPSNYYVSSFYVPELSKK